jgi:hypothetical protein
VKGCRERDGKEWTSCGTWNTIKQRRRAKMKLNMAKTRQQKIEKSQVYRQSNQQAKKEVRHDKRRWIDNQAQNAQEAAKQGNMKKFKIGRPMKRKDGHLLINERDQV